jgi:crotonobetainyl-CoA:carnitine CoA-transferase CaiB-like acyl-CoA transferase
MGPLAGIKVLDLSRVLAGPWASQCLADFGAEVIKIEKPGTGDDTRAWGPPWFGGAESKSAESAYFLSANRGKKSVAIDFRHPLGADLVRQLAATSDIVIENFKLDGLLPYGLDFGQLNALNPRLIYCSITGFGQTGPMANQPGYDAMIQAQGGIMSVTGTPDGAPQKIGVAVADLMAGMYSLSAILAALHHREKTGIGQHIDLSLLDTQLAWLANQGMNYLLTGVAPSRLGNAHPNIAPYQSFDTADGQVMIAVGNDTQFARFCDVLGHSELSLDQRFLSNAARVRNRDSLIAQCAQWLKENTTAHWLGVLTAVNVPCGPINDIAQAFAHPQIKARQMQTELPHASGAPVPQVCNPVRFSHTPIEYHLAPPLLGQHTQVVMQALGLGVAQIEKLRAEGVIA